MSNSFFDFKLFKITDTDVSTFYICNNSEGIVILIEDDNISDDVLLVKNIVQAIKKDFEKDIALVSIHKNPNLRYNKLKKDIEFSKIISFGVPFSSIGLEIDTPKNKVFLIQDKIFVETYVPTHLNANPLLKKALWEVLKTIFNV